MLNFTFGPAFIKMNFHLLSKLCTANNVLRVLGAAVGARTIVSSDIDIFNADHYDFSNLVIGSNVYIGPRCLFDLTERIVIQDSAAISAQVTFITHLDVGDQPLREQFPRAEGPITVEQGAWIGANSTVLHGVTIGEFAAVGAMSLVNRSIPANCRAFGIPCRPQGDPTRAADALAFGEPRYEATPQAAGVESRAPRLSDAARAAERRKVG